MKDISWKNKWKHKEMDRWEREDKRLIKKQNHKENRRNCKKALREGEYESDNVKDWSDLK